MTHRYVTRANILLAERGPVLLDLGVAAATELTSITVTGLRLGSVGWMAPEQADGRAVTAAADVFGWGLIVAYASLGDHPYGTGPADALLYRITHTEPDLSGVPSSWQYLLRAALNRDPLARPAVADLLALARNPQLAPVIMPTLHKPSPTTVDLNSDLGRPPGVVRLPPATPDLPVQFAPAAHAGLAAVPVITSAASAQTGGRGVRKVTILIAAVVLALAATAAGGGWWATRDATDTTAATPTKDVDGPEAPGDTASPGVDVNGEAVDTIDAAASEGQDVEAPTASNSAPVDFTAADVGRIPPTAGVLPAKYPTLYRNDPAPTVGRLELITAWLQTHLGSVVSLNLTFGEAYNLTPVDSEPFIGIGGACVYLCEGTIPQQLSFQLSATARHSSNVSGTDPQWSLTGDFRVDAVDTLDENASTAVASLTALGATRPGPITVATTDCARVENPYLDRASLPLSSRTNNVFYSEDVLFIQDLLNASGTPGVPCIPEDGYLTATTAGAVRKYQAVAGLTVDGIVGTKTYELLTSILYDDFCIDC